MKSDPQTGSQINKAAELLKAGKLVAFPTETVYGLGADATNSAAVRRIFEAKGRPSTNPLIVHVAGVMAAKRFAARWPHEARILAQQFWPGPLTLVLPKADEIVPEVSAGLNTIGIRMPNHPLTIQLLRAFEGALAGPSANKSNHLSPTTAQHVRDELGDSVDMILDGGPCSVGIESTVLDLSGDAPRILRPGAVTREQIEKLIGPIEVSRVLAEATKPLSAPGQLAVHYAPRSPAYRFERTQEIPKDAAILRVGLLSAAGYAQQFYARLRELDAKRPAAIYIEMPPNEPLWAAVRDRIIRATQPMR